MDCSLCCETFTEEGPHTPRTLDCGHTFCTRCIQMLDRTATPRQGPRCPECRAFIRFNRRSATSFPKNYKLLELIREKNEPPPKPGADTTSTYRDHRGLDVTDPSSFVSSTTEDRLPDPPPVEEPSLFFGFNWPGALGHQSMTPDSQSTHPTDRNFPEWLDIGWRPHRSQNRTSASNAELWFYGFDPSNPGSADMSGSTPAMPRWNAQIEERPGPNQVPGHSQGQEASGTGPGGGAGARPGVVAMNGNNGNASDGVNGVGSASETVVGGDSQQANRDPVASGRAVQGPDGCLVCKFFQEGTCRYGPHCWFHHPCINENKALCRHWRKGQCRMGLGCNFRHGTLVPIRPGRRRQRNRTQSGGASGGGSNAGPSGQGNSGVDRAGTSSQVIVLVADRNVSITEPGSLVEAGGTVGVTRVGPPAAVHSDSDNSFFDGFEPSGRAWQRP